MMYLKYLTLLLYLAVTIAKGDKRRGSLVRKGFFRTMQHSRENLCSSKVLEPQCKCLARYVDFYKNFIYRTTYQVHIN